ncbi:MAG: discoidin domain-containing protein, partial [Pirellulaceae bacterium]|nr:discoidin domain-containing protein [Pirellulaceae bacterium]
MRSIESDTLTRICLAIASAAWSLAYVGPDAAWAQPAAETVAVTASSQWGAGYEADAAADGIGNENGNYWQTVEKTDRGAWWQADLGQVVPVRGIQIAWACYEDKYHAPPARVIVQLSDTAGADSWKDVLTIEADRIPADEAPFEFDRSWDYPFPESVPGRFVRLLFPDGDQPNAKYDGYICLGEVQVQRPSAAPELVSIEAGFGKVDVDVAHPALVGLYLRGSNGQLSAQPLLAQRPAVAYGGYRAGSGTRRWAQQGYTYVVGEDQVRYESRLAAPEHVELREEAGQTVLRITGVTLSAAQVEDAVASEDWTLSAPADGSELVWEITRTWKRDLRAVMSGSPALFFAFDPRRSRNSVTGTVWYDPFRITASWSDLYAINVRLPGRVSENRVQTIRDRDTWAIHKLWTNWQAPVDLRLEVAGGHLYRRGSFAFLSEAGAVSDRAATPSFTQGQVEHLTLKASPVDKFNTGHQLAITLPDKATESSLRDFYGSVLNGGAINDQKGFDFGNETDGWYYAGSCWMYGAALAAGIPTAGELSAHPYSASQAFREHLAHVLSTVDEDGRAHFGYNQGGEWVDDNLHAIIGMHFYLLHTGDLHFVRQCLPALERMLAYFVQRRGPQGLFQLDDTGAHWYYDCISTSGTNGYYNAFFYKAAVDLAEMERAAGREQQARTFAELAASIKDAFNRVLWKEDAAGGPRYIDWIDAQGKEVAYFCDLCQWPPIAVGIAAPEQARKIVATADARIKQLEQEYGYPGYAGLSALWPVPDDLNPPPWQRFGIYMNGGSLLCQTYWEILARARAGDAEGAARRLRLFAQRATETSWVGNNSADMQGTYGKFESGEPYFFFRDNVNKVNPECYKANGLNVVSSNICNEITLYTDPEHSFVCCLSSLNLLNWDSITDDDIYYSIWFLDAVLSEYIEKAQSMPGMEAAVRSAIKGRAVGLGVLGWHSYLQANNQPMNGFFAKVKNKHIFRKIREQSERAT